MWEFDFLGELPSETPRVIASTVKAIQSAVRRNSHHPYIVIEHIGPQIVERLVDSPHLRVAKSSKIFYDENLRKLIIKAPSVIHETASRAFNRILDGHLRFHGLTEEVRFIGSGKVRDGGYAKEPDESYYPLRVIPVRDMKWPTVVLEVGYSECFSRLRLDGRWWLGRSGGLVKVVILLSIDRSRPRIVIEKWETVAPAHSYHLRSQSPSPQLTAEVTVTLVNDDHVTTGAPLAICVDDLLMYPVPIGVTFQFDDRDLISLARAIWMEQQFVQRPQLRCLLCFRGQPNRVIVK
ncbi:uncharacterized protein LDX57_006802 [Aspergillus melleus]|uniref:uncharacterized protein n=1 Tax=Aspergillus melleus TaxID=138277 RepID=UPI001E8D1A42|nr:uncharacterized protein LDX57_006802 [Aspergillus melleus]KAH8429132.1 hypothetical protein LDX57_006802 [Aspergillus melleus]